MKKAISLLFLLAASASLSAEDLLINTKNSTLLLRAYQGKELFFDYYGPRIDAAEAKQIHTLGLAVGKVAYPTFNGVTGTEPALAVEHTDGALSLTLKVKSVSEEPSEGGKTWKISTGDDVYPFSVDIFYRTYEDEDIIETWQEISHREKGEVKLLKYASCQIPLRSGDVWILHESGDWGRERDITVQPLLDGEIAVCNRDGVRNSQQDVAEIMLSLDGEPREQEGRTIGMTLEWSGNFKISAKTVKGWPTYHYVVAGIDDLASAYYLPKNKVFETPKTALSFSSEGMGQVSRNFHKWGREHRLAHGTDCREILLNSWEGVYLDVDQEKMTRMMREIADLGGELFVMDDGWFGTKYPRNVANAALGDWVTDTRKLPGGIQPLIDEAKANGIKFGIWIEPEMGNYKASMLWDNHPDWFLSNPGRDPKLGRGKSQMVLDLSNPAVQDYVFGILDGLMTDYPEIYYIKWDANMNIRDCHSAYQKHQSNLYTEYHKGLESTLKRIRAKYPDLIIQACASGGGRVNYGNLQYFDEFWTSDDTDPMQRIYIQWGTSMFYPAVAMASHISASPNHQTQQEYSLKFRTDVAMSGRLGMEMRPWDLDDAEKEFVRKAFADYKRLRPVIQQGDLYRLNSPYDTRRELTSSLMYVSPDKSSAVFFGFELRHMTRSKYPLFRMAGLDPEKTYRLHEINAVDKSFGKLEGAEIKGRILMECGLDIPFPGERSSRVIELSEVR